MYEVTRKISPHCMLGTERALSVASDEELRGLPKFSEVPPRAEIFGRCRETCDDEQGEKIEKLLR